MRIRSGLLGIHLVGALACGLVLACVPPRSSTSATTKTRADTVVRRDTTTRRAVAARTDSAARRDTSTAALDEKIGRDTNAVRRDVRADSAAPGGLIRREALDGTRLHPGRWMYSLTLRSDTTVRMLGVMEHGLAEGTHAGVPSWVFTTSGTRAGVSVAESLWVTRGQLAAQHWASVVGPSRLSAEFTRDTVYAAVTAPAGRRSIASYAPTGVLVNEPMTDAVLGLLPLASGFTDSLQVLVVDLGGCAAIPARLTTDGEERVTVPAGTFDALVLTLEAERGGARFWIDKATRVVLRSEQTLPELGGAVLRRELVRAN